MEHTPVQTLLMPDFTIPAERYQVSHPFTWGGEAEQVILLIIRAPNTYYRFHHQAPSAQKRSRRDHLIRQFQMQMEQETCAALVQAGWKKHFVFGWYPPRETP